MIQVHEITPFPLPTPRFPPQAENESCVPSAFGDPGFLVEVSCGTTRTVGNTIGNTIGNSIAILWF